MPNRTVCLVLGALLAGSVSACGSGSLPGSPAAGAQSGPRQSAVAPGPVTLVALGDSLTAGVGDDSGVGFVGRLTDSVAALPGRSGSTSVNLGQSGWDSTMLVDGQQGAPAELAQALDAVRSARGPVLATVLIGSNDLWYVYQNGSVDPTPAADEDAAVATYRTNLDRAVRELRDAGAVVVIGLPDDQSKRPGVADLDRLHQQLADVTGEEVSRMSLLAGRLADTARDVADARGCATVVTDDPFWADQTQMAEDRIHPNGSGYAVLARRWAAAVEPLLRAA